jgi:hypothetical protein
MDSSNFAFTAECVHQGGNAEQLWLYTYGDFPDAVSEPRHTSPQILSLSAYPNPFGSLIQLALPDVQARRILLYDILGRQVWSGEVPRGSRFVTLTDPSFSNLPSGTYFLTLQGNSKVVPQQITHFK